MRAEEKKQDECRERRGVQLNSDHISYWEEVDVGLPATQHKLNDWKLIRSREKKEVKRKREVA